MNILKNFYTNNQDLIFKVMFFSVWVIFIIGIVMYHDRIYNYKVVRGDNVSTSEILWFSVYDKVSGEKVVFGDIDNGNNTIQFYMDNSKNNKVLNIYKYGNDGEAVNVFSKPINNISKNSKITVKFREKEDKQDDDKIIDEE